MKTKTQYSIEVMSDEEGDDVMGAMPAMLAAPKRTHVRRKSTIVAKSLVGFHVGNKGGLAKEKSGKSGLEVLQGFLEAVREISSKIDPQDVADAIIKQTCSLLHCDRASIFYVDEETDELVLMIAKGVRNIRVPIGNGIAGCVARDGTTDMLDDAYTDSRFSDRHDRKTGYKTNAVLATPVVDHEGNIIAVLQCVSVASDSVSTTMCGTLH
jgi:putative methionine-R-sulfoxide reductase with GAF domain